MIPGRTRGTAVPAPSTPGVRAYAQAHSTPDPVATDLAARTRAAYRSLAVMQAAPEVCALLGLLVRLSGARAVVEVGTFTGASSLAMARALPPDGRLLTCDISERATDLARTAWQRAGVADRVELRLGPAAATLAALPADEQFDLAFVDADKAGYPDYHRLLLPRVRRGGLLVYDNTLLDGAVLDPAHGGAVGDGGRGADADAIRRLNDELVADERLEVLLLPVADGLTLVRRR